MPFSNPFITWPSLMGLLLAALASAAWAGSAPPVTQLKPLCLETVVVQDGQPHATIVVPASGRYDQLAERIVQSVMSLTGAKLAIAKDASPAALPIQGNVIALGNRSTNRLIAELYNRYLTLLDLKYPGEGGFEVRSLHNPFGNAHNVVFVGGSDLAGVEKACEHLIQRLKEAATQRTIRLGRLADIQLDRRLRVPKGVEDAETWEASAGYGSIGYFGWNSLSKRMALYYVTGDPVHARELLRLAFPDEMARQEITRIDGERIEVKDRPLSGPYHYTAHLMILFWDLIEESPVFTDEDRLRITRAFADQVDHWEAEMPWTARPPQVPKGVGSRHGQWAAVSRYCLARYFQAYYPNPFWQRHLEAAVRQFLPLHKDSWVNGENDNLYWYNTAHAPILTYMLLSGDRVPLENGVLAKLLRGQEILISGRAPDWALNSAALDFLHKAAYLTQDGRWTNYRDRTGLDTDVFRLGQSFWPEEHLAAKPPEDLVGKWTIDRLSRPEWESRQSGVPADESFHFASFRSRPDAGGDFILLDGFNGASRNPYHTFAILELRLAGYTLLKDYFNQVITRVDGLMESRIPMDAALKQCDVLGPVAFAAAEVPRAGVADWRRTLIQRTGRYAMVIDSLVFPEDSQEAEACFAWETELRARPGAAGELLFSARTEDPKRGVSPGGKICMSDPMPATPVENSWWMRWTGPVKAKAPALFFSLVGIQPGSPKPALECHRLSERAAVLGLPEPAVVGVGLGGASDLPSQGKGPSSNPALVILASDHVTGHAAAWMGSLCTSQGPIDLDWDLGAGTIHLNAKAAGPVQLCLAPSARPTLQERPLALKREERRNDQRLMTYDIPAGRHRIEGAVPDSTALARYREDLRKQLDAARAKRAALRRADAGATRPAAPAWNPQAAVQVSSAVVDLEVLGAQPAQVAAAEGKRVHLLAADGRDLRTLAADGPIRMLRWWPEPQLLLAGCADEKVIAFDVRGISPISGERAATTRKPQLPKLDLSPSAAREKPSDSRKPQLPKLDLSPSASSPAAARRWEFVSQMDPAVELTGKTYWYKSAPGHEGIHGLHTGTFLDGRSQAFVGSACTIEILDEKGNLVKRLPRFWGQVSLFALVDGPQGTRNLLSACVYNGVNDVAIVNTRSLRAQTGAFMAVPPGHTNVGGWSSMNRRHLFYEDLDGDGTREVAGEINGTWNRVCVWAVDGTPKYAANLGPGPRIPGLTVRDLAVCDLEGDGKKEIVVATAQGMLIALDARCQKRWSVRLPSPASVLECVCIKGGKEAQVIAGCDDGRLRVLDASGQPMRTGTLAGKPGVMRQLADADGNPLLAVGTDRGEVSFWRAHP